MRISVSAENQKEKSQPGEQSPKSSILPSQIEAVNTKLPVRRVSIDKNKTFKQVSQMSGPARKGSYKAERRNVVNR